MTWLCLACSKESSPAAPLKCCPNCGDTGVPADTEKKVTVSLTLHELRILVIWAEFYAGKILKEAPVAQRIIYGIADRLVPQLPADAGPLTFMAEISELRGAGYQLETNFPEPPMETP